MPKIVNHVNIADVDGQIYCRKLDRVVTLDGNHTDNHCSVCNMFTGSAQGSGVECEWTDTRPNIQNPHVAPDATIESDDITINDFRNKKKK